MNDLKKRRIPLHFQIIIGLALGVAWAFLSGYLGLKSFTLNWIAPFGDIFINLLKLIAVPLVLFSIIDGIAGLSDTKKLGRLGIKTLAMYLITTVTAVSLGLVLVNMIKPGNRISDELQTVNRLSYEMWAGDNNVKIKDGKHYLDNAEYTSYINEAKSKLSQEESNATIEEKMQTARSQKDKGPLQFLVEMVPSNIFLSFNNSLMLQVIFFAIFFGITLISLPRSKVAGMINFVEAGSMIFIKMVDIVMRGAPYFVFALMAGKLTQMANDNTDRIINLLGAITTYMVVVIAGLCIMAFILYPLLITRIVKKLNYRGFFKAMAPAQFLAFSSSSSAATLPVTMDCVQKNLGVKEEVSSFVLPIGATVNMDGTSLYQAVAVVFLAQLHGVDLNLTQQLTIVMTATLASIGTAAVPSAGLIMLIIVLQSVGLNPAWIALIFPVDRILDMCRTVVNVTGDATVATIVASTEGMMEYPPKEE
ncbi:MAG: dicarboxylate/amino acid:cation symporter [Chitinophagaceae bacterium]|nr:dicarboxylate/amino acid:cation symporter [Chitinophagaceae bacterium]MCB9047486.1 dicarboxylate/amino acid:cation symporter [Chitinophagales bacterium]